jgi:DNA (cytosine-5)-methyltransferase 1
VIYALDLFCGAGGVTKGLQDAGFHVFGVDIKRSPRYCGNDFRQRDVLSLTVDHLRWADFIWASPPCQAHTSLKAMHNAKQHVDLIAATRALLIASGRPYVIENVPGAPLINPIKLRGTMFGLGVAGKAQLIRERWFETSFPVGPLPDDEPHPDLPVIGVYGGHVRNRSRPVGTHHAPGSDFTFAEGREAMQIFHMNLGEMSQAIPPIYSEWLAREWLKTREMRMAA